VWLPRSHIFTNSSSRLLGVIASNASSKGVCHIRRTAEIAIAFNLKLLPSLEAKCKYFCLITWLALFVPTYLIFRVMYHKFLLPL
jgi:hypothetical protein